MSFRWIEIPRRGRASRKSVPSASVRARQLQRRALFEALEQRELLAASISLTTTTWTPIGPAPIVNTVIPGGGPTSGRVTGIAADPSPSASGTFYIATAGGGVWKTTNDGTSWTPLTDTQASLVDGAIAIAPSNDKILYVGTGEANNRSTQGFNSSDINAANDQYGQGILVSTNAGQTWTLQNDNGVFTQTTVAKIVVDPNDPNTVYAAVDNNAFNGSTNSASGIYKSTDGGKTWTDTTSLISTTSIYSDLVINPATPSTLYMAIGGPSVDVAGGIYESKNSGGTWTLLSGAPAGVANGRIALAISQSNPQILYAAYANNDKSVLNPGTLEFVETSTDGGNSWSNVAPAGNPFNSYGNINIAIAVDPNNSAVVYLGGYYDPTLSKNSPVPIGGILESTNAGGSWSDISVDTTPSKNGPQAGYHAFAFTSGGTLLTGTDGGIWQLQNPNVATLQWQDLNTNLQITQFNSVSLDPLNPNIVYGGTQNNGSVRLNYAGTLQWQQLPSPAPQAGSKLVLAGDASNVFVDPTNDQVVYRERDGFNLEFSVDGGNTWSQIGTGVVPVGSVPFPPFQLEPANPQNTLFGTWAFLQEMTFQPGPPPSVPNTVLAQAGFSGYDLGFLGTGSVVTALANSLSSPSTIYVAASGVVYVTTNKGLTWTSRSIPNAPGPIDALQVDPTNSQIVYAACNILNAGSPGGHLFRSINGGKNWTDISTTLPNLPVNAIALNVASGNTQIWLGTDAGVYYSSDLGQSWGVYRTGLPNAQVVSLQYDPNLNILLAGTNGRGAWEIKSSGVIGITSFNQSNAVEGTAQTYDSLGTFTDTGGTDPASNYSVVINWGDGTTDAGTITGNGPFTISGTHVYNEFGTYKPIMMVSDIDGAVGQAKDTIVVVDAPLTATSAPTTLTTVEGNAFSGAVATFTDGNAFSQSSDLSAVINWGDGASSNGQISFDAATSTYTVSGKHTYLTFGDYPVSVSIADKGGSTASAADVMVVTDAALSPVPLTFAAVEGTAFTGTVAQFTDADPNGKTSNYTATIDWGDNTTTFGASIVRAGVGSFDIISSHIYTRFGTYQVSATVSDIGGSATNVQSTAIVADAPMISSGVAVGSVEGQTLPANTIVATFNDTYPAAPQSGFSATIDWGNGTSSVGTITATGNGHYNVTGSTLYQENGTYPITVTINDVGGATTTALSRAQVGDAPLTSTNASLTGTEGQAIPTSTLASFTDANLYATPSDFNVTIDWGDGSTSSSATITTISAGNFNVSAGHQYTQAGTFNVGVTITDVGGQTGGSSTFVTDVAKIADVPLIAGSPFSVAPELGAPFSGSVAQFSDPNLFAQPSDFVASINWGDGTTSGAVVTQASPPIANNDAYSTPQGKPLAVTAAAGVLNNDISPTGVVLVPTLVPGSGPSHGTLTFNADGSFTYVPATGFFGADSFTYTDFNGITNSAAATVSLTVTSPKNIAPVANNDAYSTIEGKTLTVPGPGVLTNDTNPSAGTLVPTLQPNSGPSNGTLAFNPDGSFIYVPNAGFSGTDSFSYTVFDGTSQSNIATVTLNVLPPAAPGPNGPVFTVTPSPAHTYVLPTAAGQPPYALQIQITDIGGEALKIPGSATVADAPIVSAAVSGLQVVQGTPLSGVIATFTDANNLATATNFTATINWGDGNITQGVISYDPTTQVYSVTGANTYNQVGNFTANVAIQDNFGTKAPLVGTPIFVTDAPITAGQPLTISAVAGTAFSGVIGTFTDADANIPPNDFTATINWGDGTTSTPGNGVVTQPLGPGTPYNIFGTHTYATSSSQIPISITITALGGTGISEGALASVIPPLTLAPVPGTITGGLSTGLTRDNQPQFTGQVEPDTEVDLFANGKRVGTTISDASGNWTITSSALADGSYTFSAEMLNPSMTVGPIQTVTYPQAIVVDTTGPAVASVVFDPRGQQLHVTLQDTGSGLNLASIANAFNYQLTLPTGRTTTHFAPTGFTLSPGPLGSGQITVNLSYNLGRRIRSGAYVVTILANNLTDNAGNTLVERTFVAFPQTTNFPNPNYIAQISVGRNLTASGPQVYITPAERRAAELFARRVHRK